MMRPSLSLTAVVLGSAAVALASPIASSPRLPRYEVSADVAGIGQCPFDCWNEAAAQGDCDPNNDDDCLCGPFFDAVTACTSQTCDIGDNLAALAFLEPACS